MMKIKNVFNSYIALLAIISLMLILEGCSSTTPQMENSSQIAKPEIIRKTNKIVEDLPSKFVGIKKAMEKDDFENAEKLLSNLDFSKLTTIERNYHDLVSAEIAWKRGDLGLMDDYLSLLPRSKVLKLGDLDSTDLLLKRFGGEPKVLAYLIYSALKMSQTKTERLILRKNLWSILLKYDVRHVLKNNLDIEDAEFQAWLELAELVKSAHILNLNKNSSRITELSFKHPTLTPLPGGLSGLLEVDNVNSIISLILPLSGRLAPAAKAIREGFLEAYFLSQSNGFTGVVHIIDSAKYTYAVDAYWAAVELGTDVIIGPLEKTLVAELANMEDRQIPILALNRLDKISSGNKYDFLQFSLTPIDEVLQVAELAFYEGHRNSLIISPSDRWGGQMSAALTQRWEELGGKTLKRIEVANPSSYSNQLQNALNLEKSEHRSKKIKKIAGTAVNYQLRRRRDIDVVFLLASSAEQARAIKPLLKFHFAGDLPVYATSQIYNAEVDQRNRDLNGITLVDMPLLLRPEYLKPTDEAKLYSSRFSRLRALGYDAFMLQLHFQTFRENNETTILGHSGLLSILENGLVQRNAFPAEFKNGSIAEKKY